jgi:hypothetical protein
MTINDCQEAIDTYKNLKKLKAFLEHNKNKGYVYTEDICTGRGEEKIHIPIAYSYVENIIKESIQHYIDILKTYGIDVSEEA